MTDDKPRLKDMPDTALIEKILDEMDLSRLGHELRWLSYMPAERAMHFNEDDEHPQDYLLPLVSGTRQIQEEVNRWGAYMRSENDDEKI